MSLARRRKTIGMGCDLVHIERIRKLSAEAKRKIFHPSELKNTKAESLAGIFAVKESCKKIFNELQWLDIEVRKQKNGKPEVILPFPFHGDVSISHDLEYAMAVVVNV